MTIEKYIRNFLCIIMILLNAGCGEDDKIRPLPVEIQKVQAVSYSDEKEYVGIIEGKRTAELTFLVAGTIKNIYVQEGDEVKAGDVLAEIDNTSYENAYNVAKAALEQAKDDFKRLSVLKQKSSLPESQYIKAQTALNMAEANERIAYKNLADCSLKAPFSGILSKRYLDEGTNVAPAVAVFSLTDTSQVKINTAIPEKEIALIKDNQKGRVEISAVSGDSYEGSVVEKSMSAHPISHTYDIKLYIDNPQGLLIPGMVGRVYLNLHKENTAILIPLTAVSRNYENQLFVWIADSENRAIRKEITTGKIIGDKVIIRSGIKDGDVIIVKGYQHLTEGSIISVAAGEK